MRNPFIAGLAVIVAVSTSVGTRAQSDEEMWLPTTGSESCLVKFDRRTPKSMLQTSGDEFQFKAKWDGKCSGGKIDGPGTVIIESADYQFRLTGNFVGGLLQDGGVFEAAVSLDAAESDSNSLGLPIMFRYSGQFHDNKPQGQGRMTVGDKVIMTGEFLNGAFHGNGRWEAVGIATIIGSFSYWKPHKQGIIEYANGDRYEGNIDRSIDNGHGVYVTSYGDRYEGVFRNGILYGKGNVTYADGARYEGGFDRSVGLYREGHGALVDANGNRCEGEWKDDHLVGQGQGSVDGRTTICIEDDAGIRFLD